MQGLREEVRQWCSVEILAKEVKRRKNEEIATSPPLRGREVER
ncbi:hypothetical protein [Hydrogenobaculum phage 1]|nr:hypothetical protein AUR69_gp26 [Hydrogenobaculum phage 1]ALG96937.1 hypothetical protein [Hydrogenobaculum phage 1]